MNYFKIYFSIVDRAKNRDSVDGYSEMHHVEPRCTGGNDHASNLVRLTAKEHYICHLLLAKEFPKERGLTIAFSLMNTDSHKNRKIRAKEYAWSRKAFSTAMSEIQTGSGNSQFGSMWIHNPVNGEKIKLLKGSKIPDGYFKGRNSKKCALCESRIPTDHKYCVQHREIGMQLSRNKNSPFYGREEEFYGLYDAHRNINKVCKLMGFPASDSHWYYGAKKLLEARNSPVGQADKATAF